MPEAPASQSSVRAEDSGNRKQQSTALALAFTGFMLNFWAWALLSPLGPTFVGERKLTDNAALLVAIPVLVGSLGRVPVGALTDRYGGRLMMPLISLCTIVPVLFVGFIGQYTYVTLLIGGFFLGIAGTTFAVGVPYVNSWFPPERRGTALGMYGAGMVGTAISAFTTVPLFTKVGDKAPFVITSLVLLAYAAVAWKLMRNAPSWAPAKKSIVASVSAAGQLLLTWQAMYLYAVSFGGYVAFSVYLPTFLKNAYRLSAADASFRMGGFVILAVAMRVVGGVLADRIGSVKTLLIGYALVVVSAIVVSFNPRLESLGTVFFLTMAIGLGLGTGAVFALVGQAADPAKVGSITGLVGAAGGLGGFVPPLVLGALWTASKSYSLGLILLSLAGVLAILITLWVGRSVRPKNLQHT